MTHPTSTGWMLTDQAAAYLSMHADTVRNLMRRGELQAVKVGRTWRTRHDWCDHYLQQGDNQ